LSNVGVASRLATAEVEWIYAQTLDPNGLDPDLAPCGREGG
jgi:hypothetical protein